jgi:cytoskeleton protein RodZ
VVDTQDTAAALFPERVGDRLRAARIKGGLDLSDIASKTRIPQRHLHAIEMGDYASLPGITYCIGFVKAYARAVGEDEVAYAANLRSELDQSTVGARSDYSEYQIADPTRIPSRMLAWTGVAVVLLLAIGFGIWRNSAEIDPLAIPAEQVSAASEAPLAAAPPVAAPVAPAVTPVNTAGEVTLTASNQVWVRIYDADNKVLFEKEMVTGERFAVPRDANNPQIRTGRPDLLVVTVDGKPVPPLGSAERMIKNVGISAAALAARAPSGPIEPDAISTAAPGNVTRP